ncbi:MAG: glycoside hydrolase family 78 protein [Cytophagales bacterium]|nr:glycoside hydrolase family 78 protein [Cytophagales bacterium]
MMVRIIQITLLFTLCAFIDAKCQITIKKLLTENRENPVGLDIGEPRFTWIMSSDKRNVSQSAYQIRVGLSEARLKKGSDLFWDSGVIKSDQSVHVPFKGDELRSGTRYYWQVKVWDHRGKPSKWSSTGFWQMGLLAPASEFSAKWISPGFEEDTINRPSPMFRKEFTLDPGQIEHATVYVTAHGLYEAELNGKRIGDEYLTPGWTSYNKRLQYQVYDVTDMLNNGTNAVGVTLGSGWYRGFLVWGDKKNHYGDDIALLFQINIQYTDGTEKTIISDNTWKTSTGPILSSEIYHGETYDSRKEMTGWSSPGFNDSGWKPAKEQNFSKTVLLSTYNESIKKQEVLQPQKIFTTPEGDLVVDFGQNLVGWVQLKVSGQSGDKIELYHAEVLDKEGNFYTENLRQAEQKNTFILNGKPDQVLEPHFTFQGFRYVKVNGFPGELKPEHLKAIVLHSDMKLTGEFVTSNTLLNQLQHNILWGQKGNFLDVPTDCPQRDERLGWTGDAQAFFRTAAFNKNVNNFFAKWMKDVAADQFQNGSVPFVVPNVLGSTAGGSAGWADAATIIPWELYLLYGDKRILAEQYPSMKAWLEYIKSQSQDNLWKSGFHFGDWLFYSPDDDNDGRAAITDKYFITQCFYAYSTQLLINAATVLGKEDDVKSYTTLLGKIKDAFNREFVTGSGRLVSGTQTAYVLALHFDLLPENLRSQAVERLVENIKRYKNHLTTGFLGTPYLCHVLSRFGKNDVAYDLLMQETYPSWLYPVKMGATTVWERWNGIKPDSTFETPSMNSFNHYAYGAIGDWMYRNIAGINTASDGPGYKRIVIKSIRGGGLTSAGGKLKTYYGTISSDWKIDEGKYIQEISIPVNTIADIYLPADSPERVKEGKKPLKSIKDIEMVGVEDDYIHIRVGSGKYVFLVNK